MGLHLLLIQQHPLHLQTPPASQRRRRLTLYSLCQLQCPAKLSRLHTTTLITRTTLVGTTHHLTTHYHHLAILITTLQLPIMITDMEKTVGRGKHSAMKRSEEDRWRRDRDRYRDRDRDRDRDRYRDRPGYSNYLRAHGGLDDRRRGRNRSRSPDRDRHRDRHRSRDRDRHRDRRDRSERSSRTRSKEKKESRDSKSPHGSPKRRDRS